MAGVWQNQWSQRSDRAWQGTISANLLGINCAFTVDLIPFPMRGKN
jgi:hypothetical protein